MLTGAVRTLDGQHGDAWFVEEATTNLAKNPYGVSAGGNWAIANGRNSVNTLTVDTIIPAPFPSFARSLKSTITSGGSDNSVGHTTANVAAAGDVFSSQYWVYHEEATARTFRHYIAFYNASNAWLDGPYTDTLVPPGEWTRVFNEGAAAPTGTTQAWEWIEVAGAVGQVIWVTGHQIEKKAYCTSLTPEYDASGTILPGYAWTGTAHASTSTRAAASVTAPLTTSPASLIVRYSDDDGDTWQDAYLTGPGTFGTYGEITHSGGVLTIAPTSHSVSVAGVVAFDRELTTQEQTAVTALHEWSWDWLTTPELAPGTYGDGGGITVWYDLYRATIDNALVEDISDHLTGGGVDLNHDRAITTQAVFDLDDVTVVEPYTDYLAVFLNRAYDDGSATQRDQLGLFTTSVPPGVRTIERKEGTYTGHDLTAVLGRYAFDDTYNIAAATNYVTAVTTIMALAGITRYQIPATAKTLATAKSFPVGTTYLDACNDLLEGIGYYHLSATRDGKLTSAPTQDVRYVEPVTTVADDDLMSEVVNQPTDTTVANIVIVVQDNFNAAPLTAVRRNDDAGSPTSTVNLGPRTRPETRSNLADQDAVDALADRLLAEGRSWYQTVNFRLLPSPDVLEPHQTVDLNLSGALEIFNGRYWVRTVHIGFTPETAGPVIEANRITDRIRGRLI